MAKAISNSTDVTFLGLVGSELAQKYIGEGGRIVRELFDLARERAPAIIFIDEIDSIGSKDSMLQHQVTVSTAYSNAITSRIGWFR